LIVPAAALSLPDRHTRPPLLALTVEARKENAAIDEIEIEKGDGHIPVLRRVPPVLPCLVTAVVIRRSHLQKIKKTGAVTMFLLVTTKQVTLTKILELMPARRAVYLFQETDTVAGNVRILEVKAEVGAEVIQGHL
jgi:hypothetical protein